MNYMLKRILTSVIVLIGVSIIIFVLVNLQPGNPYSHMISPNIPPEIIQEKLRQIGYYDPMYVKYFKWFSRVLKFDLGYSIKFSQPVIEVIGERLKNTVILMSFSFFFSVILGVVLGIVSAIKRNTKTDIIITAFSFIGVSIPAFFFSLALIYIFSLKYNIFPSSGIYNVRENYEGIYRVLDILKHMILPSCVLILLQITSFIRYTRSSMIEIMDSKFIKTAMSKGLSFNQAIVRHGFKNALLPIITVFCLQIPTIFSGALMTETVFSWPGVGRLGYEAVQNRDYPLIMGILMISAMLIILSNLLADILYLKIDKRIKM